MSSRSPIQSTGLHVDLKSIGDIPLELDLHCAPGELLALIGPSGSGKTTLLRALAGLYTSIEGRIHCGGKLWFDHRQSVCLKPEQRQVGLVFQQYALFPHLTVLKNLTLAMTHVPKLKRQKTAEAWLERVNLIGLQQRYPHQLSGGQRQRVALARALASNPDLLLLDEPFSAVDQLTRLRLRRELAVLRQQIQIPIVLVTHDLDEAMQLADQVGVIQHGQILQCTHPLDLMQHPNSPDTARLLGLQNIFTAHVHAIESDTIVLNWQGCLIKVVKPNRLNVTYQTQDEVKWLAPAQGILLQRPDRPVPGDSENPVKGVISELVIMGSQVSVRVIPDHAPALPISFFVPHHYLERQKLCPQMPVCLSLKQQALHIF